MLIEHPWVTVEAAVDAGRPVALVGEHVVLEPGPAGVPGGDAVGALVVDVALFGVRKVPLRRRAVIVTLLWTSNQILLDAVAEVPVRASNVHQPGQGVVPGHVLHGGEVGQLPSGLAVRGSLVDGAEQGLCLINLRLGLKQLLLLLLRLELLLLRLELLLLGLELLLLRLELLLLKLELLRLPRLKPLLRMLELLLLGLKSLLQRRKLTLLAAEDWLG